ncbi:MAG TPA: lipid IV(A) 3-deoxy-D-manno-octulosonic acid transferase [Candidatus Acidoferrum sp.]|nr:lipid IV(A) 3-deoxy-D-manno-octulosonic acid transferase [Candidatus Acidoferrum sp.]
MTRLLYSLLTLLALPLIFVRLWWRGRRNPAYRLRWRERLGGYVTPPLSQSCVVFHAVSVGEVHAAVPLVESFLRQHPQQSVVITTTTPTGSARVNELFGTRVHHVYLPYDLPWCLNGFFRQFRPALLVLLETELWPNLLARCERERCPMLLVNARLSAKSFASYQRIAGLTRDMLQRLAAVSAQATADGERFVQLGLPRARLAINGSLKFDVSVQQDKIAQAQSWKSQWQGRPVWIAASTREGEDELVLQAHRQLLKQLPSALLVLVPRHPERFGLAVELAKQRGLSVVQRSSGIGVTPATQVLVGDTMGDMHLYYPLADVAFVGGSLVPTGCQNVIEAAALGLPVVTGPSLYNFQAASDALREAGAMQVVMDAGELAAKLAELLLQPQRRLAMANAARAVVAANIGATSRTLALVESYGFNH